MLDWTPAGWGIDTAAPWRVWAWAVGVALLAALGALALLAGPWLLWRAFLGSSCQRSAVSRQLSADR